ncbi:unnamed protein product [Somion occarium]|uniref:Uncharacterized protein n=1 Tax=Somion occarium TaxID=3059160 RepID=A0ABP1DSP6_9APHY
MQILTDPLSGSFNLYKIDATITHRNIYASLKLDLPRTTRSSSASCEGSKRQLEQEEQERPRMKTDGEASWIRKARTSGMYSHVVAVYTTNLQAMIEHRQYLREYQVETLQAGQFDTVQIRSNFLSHVKHLALDMCLVPPGVILVMKNLSERLDASTICLHTT